MASYFSRLDTDLYQSSQFTMGPWDPRHQHGGPPSALIGCAIDEAFPREQMQVARVTIEILGPVPVGRLLVSTASERTGRSVELLSGSLKDADTGREVLRASVWRIRTEEVDADVPIDYTLPPGPEGIEAWDPAPGVAVEAYLTSIELRFSSGAFNKKGPAAAWARSRVTLIEGEAMPPLARVLALADTGNGISSVLGLGKWLFINPDLTVALRRLPEGEWLCLDAQTGVEPHGIGLAESVISDTRGPIGRGLQTLLIAPRPQA